MSWYGGRRPAGWFAEGVPVPEVARRLRVSQTSRGGLTTKLRLAFEQGKKPMSIVITAGQRGDSLQFEPVLTAICVPRVGPGRPRTWPDRVRADSAYASRKNRAYLRRRGIRCTIPDKAVSGWPRTGGSSAANAETLSVPRRTLVSGRRPDVSL